MTGKKHIAVTGGMGYVGSHTVVELISQGFEVTILDDLSTSSIRILDGIKEITGVNPRFFELDLCNVEAIRSAWKEMPPVDAVIHFAARKAVGESVRDPLLYYRNNFVSLLNLLQVMGNAGTNAIVFSSSCTVYGSPDKLPVNEKTPRKKAESPYGYTKMVCEDMLESVSGSTSLRALALRYFNPIGAHPSGRIGELPLNEPENLIPYITQTATGERDELKVFGSDYNTPDGTCVRDYIHVVDVARAHIAAMERLLGNDQDQVSSYEVYNIGTGTGYSVLEVVQAFEKVTGKPLPHRLVERRPGDVEAIWAETDLANRVLKWKAELGLEDMLRSAWNWQQNLSKQMIS
ncbi:MAG: UDP-glucose 4-epimerase GalE [Flavobacteriales bacterium]|nr:UDP-glucose 4-epimerase GalE [Flavobacteriales bacterium]